MKFTATILLTCWFVCVHSMYPNAYQDRRMMEQYAMMSPVSGRAHQMPTIDGEPITSTANMPPASGMPGMPRVPGMPGMPGMAPALAGMMRRMPQMSSGGFRFPFADLLRCSAYKNLLEF